jgi:AcrR family transcriptional regulator
MRDGRPTREKIRQAAVALFVERGVDAVSLRDIADAVGIRPSTIYVHWKSREDLIESLFTEGYAAYGARIVAAVAAQADFPARLEAAIRLVCRLESEDAVLFKFLLLTQHGGLHAVRDDDANPVDFLARLVTGAVIAGEATVRDPQLLTAAIVGIVVQAATFRLYGRIGRSLDEMADEIVDLCLSLATKPS